MMLGCFMCAGAQFHDGRTILLIILLTFLAYLLRLGSQWPRPKAKRFLALATPLMILLCWFVLQREMLFTDRMSRAFYRSIYGDTVWRLNSAILIAFGIAFSLRVFRGENKHQKVYGSICLLAFLPLLIGFRSIGPVAETSSVAYHWDRWMHPSVMEPAFEGKSLSYWASRVNGLADEAEPALEAIRAMGTEGVRALMRAFQAGEGSWNKGENRPQPWSVRQHAAEALIKLGPDAQMAVPLMVESLRNSDRTIRGHAAEVLGRTGDRSPVVLDALIKALDDEATEYPAMKSLARLGKDDPTLIRRLASTAKGSTFKAAYWATVALAEIGHNSSIVLPDLIECVQRASNDQRQHAVQAIAIIGTNASSAVPALIAVLNSSKEWTRKCIYIAFGRIGPAASNSIPSLLAATEVDPDLQTTGRRN
jgi:HEAT repeat protein